MSAGREITAEALESHGVNSFKIAKTKDTDGILKNYNQGSNFRKKKDKYMRRFRRLRAGERIRSLVRETRIDKGDLIYPIFIAEGENIKKPVDSMPNVYQYSLDRADEILKEIENSGIAGLLIFGIPKHKDELATAGL